MRRVATAESLDRSKFNRHVAKSFAGVLLLKLILPLRRDSTAILLLELPNFVCSLLRQQKITCYAAAKYADFDWNWYQDRQGTVPELS
jgi:hypothetical protein